MKTAICIITSGRKALALRLVTKIALQLKENDHLFIIENGKKTTSTAEINKIRTRFNLQNEQLRYLFLVQKSIPVARNEVFKLVKTDYDLLIYIDDDCRPTPHWLLAFKQVFLDKNVKIAQGKSTSVPIHSNYVLITQSLFDTWLNANTSHGNQLSLADTKNLAIRLNAIQHLDFLFNQKVRYGSDIEMWCRLKKIFGKTQFVPKAEVFHLERYTLMTFLRHRLRLSNAYQDVLQMYPNTIKSATFLKKTTNLLVDFQKISNLRKCYILVIFFTLSLYLIFHRLMKKVSNAQNSL